MMHYSVVSGLWSGQSDLSQCLVCCASTKAALLAALRHDLLV